MYGIYIPVCQIYSHRYGHIFIILFSCFITVNIFYYICIIVFYYLVQCRMLLFENSIRTYSMIIYFFK